jgi:DNA-3-methyladenine glycosylase
MHGLEAMRARRGFDDERLLCSGPGRLCQALGVTKEHDGLPLDRPPFALAAAEAPVEVVAGTRIGITRAAELPWRYGVAGSRFLSRALPRARP